MQASPLEIITRCIVAILLSAGIYYAAIHWPDPLVWFFLLCFYVGVVFMTLRDMAIFRLGAFSWFIVTPCTIFGFVMWIFFAFIFALLGTIIIPLRLLWNILRLLVSGGGNH